MNSALKSVLFLIVTSLALPAIAQTTITYADGETNATAYDTTGNDLTLTIASGSANQSGVLSGTGTVTKTGSGALTLSGANTYSGGTTISAGTLQIDATGSIIGNVANEGTFVFNRSDDYTFNGVISGSGGMVNDGYILRLVNPQTYTGPTSVKSGGYLVLSTTNDQGLSASTTVDLEADSFLDISNRAQTIAGLSGSGTVYSFNAGAGHLTLDVTAGQTFNFAGTLGHTYPNFALTKTGAGTQILSGSNSYTGATNVNAGTLRLGSSNALASTASVDVASGATLDLNGNTITLADLDGAGSIALGSANLTTGDANDHALSGVISGTGSLTKAGSGALTLSGANTFTGATTITAGTLSIDADSRLGAAPGSATAGHLTLNGGTLATTADFTLSSNRGLTFGANSGTLDVASGTTLTYATPIVGDFTKSGAGTLELTGINSLFAVQNRVIAAGSLHWNHSAGEFYTYQRGVLSGAGNLILTSNPSSGIELQGVNTFTGTTTIRSGNVVANADSAFGTAPSTATPGHLILDNGTLQTNTNLTIDSNRGILLESGGGTFQAIQGTSITYGGIITGSGALTKTGAGDLTLGGANTFSGETSITSHPYEGILGTLTLGHTDALQNSTLTTASGLRFGSLTSANLGGLSGAENLALTNGSSAAVALSVGGNDANTTYAGVLSGAGSLTKSGTGTLTLSGANTFTGDTTIAASTLTLGHADALQNSTLATATGLSFGSLTSANLGGLSGSQNLSLTNGSSAAVALSVGANHASTTYSGVLSGTGSLTKVGTGTLILSGTNTYTGATTLSAGTLALGHATNTLADSGAVTVAGGTLALGANSDIIGAFSLSAGSVTGTGTGTLTASSFAFSNADSASVSTVLAGNAALAKSGAGTLTLSGANTYSGGTTVSAGTLTGDTTSLQGDFTNNANLAFDQSADASFAGSITGTGALIKTGAGNLTLSGANTYSGGTTVSAGTLTASSGTIQGNVVNNSAFVLHETTDGTYAGSLSGTGSFTKTGSSNLTLSGTHTHTGGTTVSAGTMTLGSASASGSVAGNITNNGTLVFNRTDDYAYSGVISGTGGLVNDGYILRFDQAQTYTGPTAVKSGGYLILTTQADQGLAASTTVDLESGSVFDFSNRALTLAGLTGAGTVYSFGGSSGHLTLDIANTNTFAGALGPGGANFALAKSGAGTLTLSGTNTFAGGTTISAGTLALGHATDTLADTGAVTVAGGTLALGANSDTIGAFSLSAGSVTGTGTLTASSFAFSNADSASVSTVLAGNAALAKAGAGSLILTGANTYTGTTTIGNGTLQVGAGGTTGTLGSGAVVNNAALAFNRSDNPTFVGNISGTGSITQNGTGTLTLSGTNTYTGNTNVQSGTLAFASTNAFYGGTVDATTAARLSAANGTVIGLGVGGDASFTAADIGVIAASANFGASAKLALDTTSATGGVATLDSLSTGATNLQKTGVGTLAFTGTTSGSGTLDILAGTVRYDNTGAFLGGAVNATNAAKLNVASGATLAFGIGGASSFSNADFTTIHQNASFASGARLDLDTTQATGGAATLNDLDVGTVGFAKTGTGSLTLTGTTTNPGATTVAGGSLIIGSDALLGAAPGTATTGHLTLNGGTLNTTGTFALDANRGVAIGTSGGAIEVNDATTLTVAGSTSGTGTLTKSGTGTLTLAQGSATTGTITVSAGTLQIGNGGIASLGTTGITNNGTLDFNHTSDLTLSGTLDGTGNLTKTGSGTLTIGTLSSTGTIAVTGGDLATNTSIGDRVATIAGTTASITHSGAFNTVGTNGTGSLGITAGGDFVLSSTSSFNYLTIGSVDGSNGTVTVNGDGSSIQSNGRLRAASSGTGTLNIEAGATAAFNHASDSYVGNTSTGNGTVNLSGTNSALTIAARLIVGNSGTGTVNVGTGATLTANRLQLATNTGSTGTLNLNTGGTLVVSDATNTALSTGAGTATFNFAGGTLKSNGTNSLTVTSNATLANGTTSTFDTNGQAGTWSGILSGSGGLTKAGAGTLTLSGANTYTGGTTLSAGTLSVGDDAHLGHVSGAVAFGGGQLQATANFTATRATTLGAGGGTFLIDSGVTLTWNGAITGAAGNALTKIGVGTLVLGGANTYSGDTFVNAGTLRLAAANALSPNTKLNVASGANFDPNGFTPTFSELSGAGNLALGAGNLAVAQAGNTTFSGIISGSGGLAKSGAGTLTLTGINTFSGATSITGGQLKLDGSAANSAFNVSGGGTLSGNGTLGALTINSGGILAPGNSPGTLNASDTTFAGGGSFQFEINDTTGAAGTAYDLLAISGALAITATSGTPFTIDVTSLTLANVAGNAANFDSSADYAFTFVTTTGGITGFAAEKFAIDTTAFTNPFSGTWSLAQSGNNLTLNYAGTSAIPEPSTYAVIAGACVFALAAWRKRRRAAPTCQP